MPSTRLSRQDSIVEVLPPGPSNTKRSSQNKTPKAAPKIVDIIEISDSEDDKAPSLLLKRQSSREHKFERDLKKLKQENDEHKNKENFLRAELSRFQDEIALLRSTSSNAKSLKDHMPISEIEDSVTCEVCTMKMWTPYILECGHTYCQSCLQDWFSTTLALHIAAHPNYNLNQPQHNYGAEMYAAYGHNHYLHLLGATAPQPQYTCPTCREQVRNPPVEDYNLKKIVRAVASAQGESSPRKKGSGPSRRKDKAKGKSSAQLQDPWSGFFRKRT